MAFSKGTPVSASEYNSYVPTKITKTVTHTLSHPSGIYELTEEDTDVYLRSNSIYNCFFEVKSSESFFPAEHLALLRITIDHDDSGTISWYIDTADFTEVQVTNSGGYNYEIYDIDTNILGSIVGYKLKIELPASTKIYNLKSERAYNLFVQSDLKPSFKLYQGSNNVSENQRVRVWKDDFSGFIEYGGTEVTRALAKDARLGGETI